jgi:large subunit ribosomal protein L45
VRLHSQQILAIYDRFGRLIHGSENVVKDVLEYVVYENFLTNSLGQWRIHGKILPQDRQTLETPVTFRVRN